MISLFPAFKKIAPNSRYVFEVAASMLLVSMMTPFVLGGNSLAIYHYLRNPGLLAGVIFLGVSFSGATISDFRTAFINRRSVTLIVLVAGSFCVYQLAVSWLSHRVGADPRLLQEAFWIPFSLVFVIHVFFKNFRVVQSPTLFLSLLAVTAGLIPALKVGSELLEERMKPILGNHREMLVLESVPKDLDAVVTEIQRLSKRDDVFASNVFCPFPSNPEIEDCFDEGWWERDYSRRVQSGDFEMSCATDSSRKEYFINFWLPALTERRFLIQGPDYLAWCLPDISWITDRISVSEKFGRFADPESCINLVDRGVKWFVRDLRVPHEPMIQGSVMKTDVFELVELQRETCGI